MLMGSQYLSSQYEGFDKLLTQLQTYINSNGVSKDLQNELDEVNEELNESKQNYMKILTIYTAIQEILVENNYGLNDQTFSTDDDETYNIYRTLSELFSAAESKNCLDISLTGSTRDEEHLFGLVKEDFELELRNKKIIHQNIQQVCIPLIEAKLQKKALELYKCWNTSSQDSEGLMLAKANQMATLVKKEKAKLKELKLVLRENENSLNAMANDHHKKLKSSLQHVETLIRSCKNNKEDDMMNVTADWVEAKCEYILGKIKVMKNHLYSETYSKDAIEALHLIKSHLDEEMQKTKKELQQTRYSLSAYESVGETFTQLLHQYTQLTAQIDNKKWALSELLKSKST